MRQYKRSHPLRGTCSLILTAFCCCSALRADDTNSSKPAAADGAAAVRPAIGSIDVGDYCTILLAPKLQDKLDLTDDQRETMADLKTDLKSYVDNAIGNMHGPPTAGLIAARSETALAMIGKKVRLGLTPQQDKALVALFDDGTLKPITVNSSLTTGGPEFGRRGFWIGALNWFILTTARKRTSAPRPARRQTRRVMLAIIVRAQCRWTG